MKRKGPQPRKLAERFWEKVDRRGRDDCWEWQATRNAKGYGKMLVGSRSDGTNRKEYAHRLAWRLTHGRPAPQCVLHSCDNPPCCNPRHLREGSWLENTRDAQLRGRLPIGEEHPCAKLSVNAVREARAAYRRGEATYRILADRYGVTVMAMYYAVNGRTWRAA